jgi:hypothetical protein
MMYSEALAIAEFALQIGAPGADATAQKFTARAKKIQQWYLANLWDESIEFFGVFKPAWPYGNTGCVNSSTALLLDAAGAPLQDDGSTSKNTVGCPPKWQCDAVGAGMNSTSHQRGGAATPLPGVRELLGLGPAYYFQIVPKDTAGAKFDQMWQQLFDADGGFWAEWGPTTAERRHPCFNMSQDSGECTWNGMSWPYLFHLFHLFHHIRAAVGSSTSRLLHYSDKLLTCYCLSTNDFQVHTIR